MADSLRLDLVEELLFKSPFRRKPRVFPVLTVIAYISNRAFIKVQIPIQASQLAHLAESVYCKDYNDAVPGTYAGVEYCYLTEQNRIQWVKAISINAPGPIPKWAQMMGIPSAMAREVPFFMDWIQEQRNKRMRRSQHSSQSQQGGQGPQCGQSPQHDQAQQNDESPQNGQAQQNDESPQNGQSPQVNQTPQNDQSPQNGQTPAAPAPSSRNTLSKTLGRKLGKLMKRGGVDVSNGQMQAAATLRSMSCGV